MTAQFPDKLAFLFEPARFKVAYGGRDGSKSWGFARALLIMGAERKLLVLCARELMNSIKESVHRVLSNQIANLGLEKHYRIEQSKIIGTNGTEFVFAGLKNNIDAIKSLEGADIVWVEEAANVSKASWDKLIPTVRKAGSEIWVSFNPELADDDTWKRFVVNPPPGAVVVKILHTDNPWPSEVLRAEREELAERDPASYANIWLGQCKSSVEGAVYFNELRDAEAAGRLTRIPYDATLPVSTFWDIGWGDNTAIWFAQAAAFEYRLIDYIEDSRKPLEHYLKLLQAKGYLYGTHYLPHDAKPKQFGSGRSIQELMEAAGFKVEIVAKLAVADGINAARTVFQQCWFDQERCADGLTCLRRYRYAEPGAKSGALAREPIHDIYSHGADAFRYFAVSIQHPERERPHRERAYSGGNADL